MSHFNMKKQDYSNHIRFYTPHHFIFYPLIIAAMVWAGWHAKTQPETAELWIAIAAIFGVMGWLSFMLRQHYALTNQNRIVRLEMRLRYYELTGQRLEPVEHKLSFGQLAALRFASNEELPALVQRTLSEQLTPDAIKRSIKNWVADDMRV